MTAFCDKSGIIDLWTSTFLQEFDCRSKSTVDSASKPHVAFGRTTHAAESNRPGLTRSQTVPILLPSSTNGRINRISFHHPTKLSDSRIQLTNEFLTRISVSQSKVRGSQMLNFKLDLSKAREKRKRQLQYSREIQSGAKTLHSREIDSVTRIVVQSFRKLIDCERCALFLMDESTNELYFKPIDDIEHSQARLREVRFPATSGVAGWVASNKVMLNIKNAYHDSRFNADIDKKTGFRTRTILCHPVLSSTNQLLGVIQMVNKKRSNPKELHDKAKKKGYQSNFEHFSEKDEEILGKCCTEVSKSLEDIFARQHRKRVESEAHQDGNIIVDDSGNESSPITSSNAEDIVVDVSIKEAAKSPHVSSRVENMIRETRIDGTTDQSSTTDLTFCTQRIRGPRNDERVEQSSTYDSTTCSPEPQRRDSTRRRSSVGERQRSSIGDLATFVKGIATSLNIAGTETSSPVSGVGITEAIQKLHLRDQNSELFQQREMERRNSDAEYLLALAKRERMMDYGQQLREPRNDVTVEQSSTADSTTCASQEPQQRDSTRRRSSVGERRRSSVGELAHAIQANSTVSGEVESAFQGMGITEAIQRLHFRDHNSEILQQREMERRKSDAEYLNALSKRERMMEYGQQLRDPRNDESVDMSSAADSTTCSPEPRCRDSTSRRSSVHFVHGNTDCDIESAFQGLGITEAIQKFHFRARNSVLLQQRESERRNSDAEYLLAQSKRERMLEYGQQLREPKNDESMEQSSAADISTTCSPAPQRRDLRTRSSVSERRRSSVSDLAHLVQGNHTVDGEVETAFQGTGITEAIQKLRFRDQNSKILHQREMDRRKSDAEYLNALSKRGRMMEYGQQLREPRNDQNVEPSSTTDNTTCSPEPQRRDSMRRRSSVGERRRSSIGDFRHLIQCNSNLNKDKTIGGEIEAAFQGMGITEAIQKLHLRDHNPELFQQRESERRNSDAEYLLAQSKRERMLEYSQQVKERRSSDAECLPTQRTMLEQSSTTDNGSASTPDRQRQNSARRRSSVGDLAHSIQGDPISSGTDGCGVEQLTTIPERVTTP